MQEGGYELDCTCHGFDKLLEYMRKGKLPPKLDVDDLVCNLHLHHASGRHALKVHGIACASGNWDDDVCML